MSSLSEFISFRASFIHLRARVCAYVCMCVRTCTCVCISFSEFGLIQVYASLNSFLCRDLNACVFLPNQNEIQVSIHVRGDGRYPPLCQAISHYLAVAILNDE